MTLELFKEPSAALHKVVGGMRCMGKEELLQFYADFSELVTCRTAVICLKKL